MTHRIGVGVGTREGLGSCCSEGGMDGGAKGREGERASTGCVACARRIFGTRVTSPARVATAHTQSVSQSPSQSHTCTCPTLRVRRTWIHSGTEGTVSSILKWGPNGRELLRLHDCPMWKIIPACLKFPASVQPGNLASSCTAYQSIYPCRRGKLCGKRFLVVNDRKKAFWPKFYRKPKGFGSFQSWLFHPKRR